MHQANSKQSHTVMKHTIKVTEKNIHQHMNNNNNNNKKRSHEDIVVVFMVRF